MPTGHIIYAIDGALYAHAFDLANLEAVGGPVPVVEAVGTNPPQYAVSDSGTLAYIAGGTGGSPHRELVWVGRDGGAVNLGAEPRTYVYPRISASAEQAAFDVRDQEFDIWVLNFATGTLGRRTFASENDFYPVWTPNEERIAFQSQRAEGVGLYWKASDNTGSPEPILVNDDSGATFASPYFFTPDGTALVFRQQGHPETQDNIGMVGVDEDGEPVWLLNGEFNERNAELSPDGSWMAYQSDESDGWQIYVKPFPNVDDGRWQISNAGGRFPLWSRDGEELFYIQGDGEDLRLMTAPVETDPGFTHQSPQALLEWPYYLGNGGRAYDVSLDGEQFLAIRPVVIADEGTETSEPTVKVVLNWLSELRERVPAD